MSAADFRNGEGVMEVIISNKLLTKPRRLFVLSLIVTCIYLIFTTCFQSKRKLNANIVQKASKSTSQDVAQNYHLIGIKNCVERKLELSPHSLPITGLVSFPGSGNTWTRHLIQQMTGLGTTSCYCDDVLRMNGFPYECNIDLSKNIVVKTHEANHAQQYNFKKIVLLIRNPYDAIVSYANFIVSRHTGRAPTTVLKQVMSSVFTNSLRWYIDLITATVHNFDGPVHIVQYEKLKTDMSDTLWKLAKFLHVNVTQRDIDCTVKLQEGNFHRKTSEEEHLQLLKEVYTRDKLLQIKQVVDHIERVLKISFSLDLDIGGPTERLLLRR